MTMAVSWYYVGAMSVDDPHVEHDLGEDPWPIRRTSSPTRAGGLSLGAAARCSWADLILCVVGLLRTDASGNGDGNTLSRVDGVERGFGLI